MDWERQPTKCQTCENCGDVIYGDVWVFVVFVNEERIETKHVLCDPCKELIHD